MTNWDSRFINLAKHVSEWSKDPSTKCGAVITEGNRVVSLGFNGFPRGVPDDANYLNDRSIKYKIILHAEQNALAFANCDLRNCTLYVYPMPPCSKCAAQIIQAGIRRVVTIQPTTDMLSRWGDDFKLADSMYNEVGLNLIYR